LGSSPAYLALSPIVRILDGLAFLTVSQHIAFGVTLLVAFVAWRGIRRWNAPRRGLLRAIAWESVAGAGMLVGLVALYAAVVLIPRPHSRLVLHDPDELAVDFHSHTDHSHDGQSWFTVARNRGWHERVGFDVAYITDHAGVGGTLEAGRTNARLSGERTVLLPGVELRAGVQRIVLLGVTEADAHHFPDGAIDAAGLSALRESHPFPVPLVLTLPAELDWEGWELMPDALEGNDASPRGLEQSTREAGELRALRDRFAFPLIASSNNHGWFNAAVAWSVVRLPGWRAMTPRELDRAIRVQVAEGGVGAVRIVERTRPLPPTETLALAGTLPMLAWNATRTLTPVERVVWLFWGALFSLWGFPWGRPVPGLAGAVEGSAVPVEAPEGASAG